MAILEDTQYDVFGVANGRDAVACLCANPSRFQLVLLDLMMPYMSGIDFLTSLDALLSDPSVKTLDEPPAVLVVTSMPQEDVRAYALQDRFPRFVRGVMRKPLEIAALGNRVAALLSA